MDAKQIIIDAINESETTNTIIEVRAEISIDDARAIAQEAGYNVDYSECGRETYDIWGWTDEMEDAYDRGDATGAEMSWRLLVTSRKGN